MPYRIEFRPAARKNFKALPPGIVDRIDRAILALADNPRPPGVKKLAGQDNRWRIRVGDYRVIYEIHDDVLWVLVVEIGHRREIYR